MVLRLQHPQRIWGRGGDMTNGHRDITYATITHNSSRIRFGLHLRQWPGHDVVYSWGLTQGQRHRFAVVSWNAKRHRWSCFFTTPQLRIRGYAIPFCTERRKTVECSMCIARLRINQAAGFSWNAGTAWEESLADRTSWRRHGPIKQAP
jgi:hypothetical protein